MRLTTWNVNGIRNPFAYQPWNTARSFPAMFDILGSDIVVMQELKIQRKDLRDDMVLLDGWDCYFSLPKHKKGYSGVGIYTRSATCAPIKAEEGLLGVLPSATGIAYRDLPEGHSIGGYPTELQIVDLGVDPAMLDAEGRCVVLEFPAFVLFGVYSPANSNGLRDDFRFGFICALDCRIRNLVRAGKRVVLVGDLNVSRDETDGASALEDRKKAGMSHEEYISTPNRRIFNQLLIGGEVFGERDECREVGVLWDTTRAFHPNRKGMYTHWEQKINARPGNYGSRIDFILVSDALRAWVKDANIQEGLLGSDHCPVFIDFNDSIAIEKASLELVDVMNPPDTFKAGQRKRDWMLQDAPPFSGKRLPEFDKRRSIKSMFAVPSMKRSSTSAIATQRNDKSRGEEQEKTEEMEEKAGDISSGTGPSPETLSKTVGSQTPKRKASVPSTSLPPKKVKVESGVSASKGQQSLTGFFQPRTDRVKDEKQEAPGAMTNAVRNAECATGDEETSSAYASRSIPALTPSETPRGSTTPLPSEPTASPSLRVPSEPVSPSTTDVTISPAKSMQSFEARERTHHSWNALFSRPVAPLCESHTEPCKTMLTKKKGSNQGRSFWMCARPLGPSGSKECGTEWRCATFIWCSDWDARGGGGKEGSAKVEEG